MTHENKQTCVSCGKEASFFRVLDADGQCGTCRSTQSHMAFEHAAQTIEHREIEAARDSEIEGVLLTTETAHNLPVRERLGIVSSEAVLGMNLVKDILADVRDVFGGRSETLQKGFRDARELCLWELKEEAYSMGADAVVGVNLNYVEFGGVGKMVMLAANGTAITLAE